MLSATGLVKRYRERTVVDGVSLSLERGEAVGLLGPNGAGKTTTVRMLCGLLPPTSGELFIAGRNVAADPLEARRAIGYVPDGAPLTALHGVRNE